MPTMPTTSAAHPNPAFPAAPAAGAAPPPPGHRVPWRAASRTVALAAALATAVLAAAAAQAQQMVSVTKRANLRVGAGTQHAAQWRLDPGYPLAVVGRRGQWLKVRDFEDDEGWIYRPLTGPVRHHVVKSERANIRQGPGLRTRVVGQAVYGEVLRTLERRTDWVRVRQAGGPTGWVARRLLWGW